MCNFHLHQELLTQLYSCGQTDCAFTSDKWSIHTTAGVGLESNFTDVMLYVYAGWISLGSSCYLWQRFNAWNHSTCVWIRADHMQQHQASFQGGWQNQTAQTNPQELTACYGNKAWCPSTSSAEVLTACTASESMIEGRCGQINTSKPWPQWVILEDGTCSAGHYTASSSHKWQQPV